MAGITLLDEWLGGLFTIAANHPPFWGKAPVFSLFRLNNSIEKRPGFCQSALQSL
jgi:hypothetical protein